MGAKHDLGRFRVICDWNTNDGGGLSRVDATSTTIYPVNNRIY
jgi:hypothetical protein